MTDFRNAWLGGFDYDEIGVITGSSTRSKLPNRPGSIFRLKPQSFCIGSFFIGTETGSSGVGSNSSIAFELDAGNDTGWFKLMGDNLDSLWYYSPSGSTERMAYWIQR